MQEARSSSLSTELISPERRAKGVADDTLVSLPHLENDGREDSAHAQEAARSRGDGASVQRVVEHQLWEFFSTSVLDSPFKHIHIVALFLHCIFAFETVFGLRVAQISGRRRSMLIAAAAIYMGLTGPTFCFLLWLLRFQYIRCIPSHETLLFDAFDAPAWAGPILVIIIIYFIFSVTIYSLSVPDLRRAAMEYIDARAASHIDDLTSSERSKQVSQLQRKFLHLAVDRFRHDSKVLKIACHALFKTFAIFATAASASYFLIIAVSLMIVLFWLCALVRYVSSGRFFPRLLDVTSVTMSSCTFLALIVCFSLPIYIQQGDLGSPDNLNPRFADDGCIFYSTLFNRIDATDPSRGDIYCDSSFWSVHLTSYFNGSYPSVLYRCPLRVSRTIVYTLPLAALINLMSSFYSDDFAMKNRRVMQYTSGITTMRKSTRLSYVFPDVVLLLPPFSPLRILPVLYAGVIVLFALLDPKDYLTANCRVRPRASSDDDKFQLAFSNVLAGVAIFGFVLAYFQRTVTVVRLYKTHYSDGVRLLKALFKPKTAAPFTAKSLLEWEQAHSVLSYSRSGLNVICAFQTSSLSLIFIACVAGIVDIVIRGSSGIGIRGGSGNCTETVTVIIFAFLCASFVLPIFCFAYMGSTLDSKAARALNDLANQCKNLRERRELSCASWQESKSDIVKQRQEELSRHSESRSKRKLTLTSIYGISSNVSDHNCLDVLASPEMFGSTVTAMSQALTPLPRVVHFQKQLLALGGKAKASISFLDHIEALPPPDLLALEAVSSRLSQSLHQFPQPCRVLFLDVDAPFMTGLFAIVSSFIGSLLRLAFEGK